MGFFESFEGATSLFFRPRLPDCPPVDRTDETPSSFDSDLTFTSRLFVPVISISESLSETLARFFPFLLEDVDTDVVGAGDSRGVGLSDSEI